MTLQEFQQSIREGIPAELPAPKPYDPEVNHAPKRKDILTKEEKKLAIRNALRYFEPRDHAVLAREFAEAVSYTHLDVYKRQLGSSAERVVSNSCCILNSFSKSL